MADNKIEVEIVLDDGSIQKGFANIKQESKKATTTIGQDFEILSNKINKTFKKLIGPVLVVAGAVKGIQALTRSFADFETALTGVAKTTGISGQELQKLGGDFQELSKRIPVSTKELLGFAQQAGQFGVTGSKNLLLFSETVAKLSVSVDGISGEQAAEALVRILNVTGEGVGKIDKLASVVVALGNSIAANEGQITEAANRISGAGAVFGVSAEQAATLGAALSALGVTSEVAGTTISKTFQGFNQAIATNSDKLKKFADVAGVSIEEFKKLFEDDATEAFNKFIFGLNRVQKSGGNVSLILNNLGLSNERVRLSLLKLSNGSDQLAKAFQILNQESGTTNALNEEAARAFDTLNSKLKIAANATDVLFTRLGEKLAPVLITILNLTTDVSNALASAFTASPDGGAAANEVAKINQELIRLEGTLGRVLETEAEGGQSGFDSLLTSIFGGPGSSEEIQARIDELRLKKAELDSIISGQNADEDTGGGAAPTPDPGAGVTTENLAPSLSGFISGLEIAVIKTEVATKQITSTLKNGLARGVSAGIQATVLALKNGENAFQAFTGAVLATIGDLAIQLGTTLIATGFAIEATKALDGSGAIAAGAGLVAIGTLLKAAFGGTGVGTAASGAAGGGPGFENDPIASEEEDFRPQTNVQVDISGQVLNTRETAADIVKIINDSFDTEGTTIARV